MEDKKEKRKRIKCLPKVYSTLAHSVIAKNFDNERDKKNRNKPTK